MALNFLATFRRIIKFILIVGIAVFSYSFFQIDDLPPKNEILPELYRAPLQVETDKASFEIERGGIVYEITPLFEYELYGLVVSYHHAEDWLDYYHQRWKDHINLKDVCVVWGENIASEVYQDLKVESGSFTCRVEAKNETEARSVFSQFKNNALSNNHLLSDSEEINKKIVQARSGDQIYFRGYLVEYKHGGGFERGSSITRDDRGNGACETIYLTDFKILKKGNSEWYLAYHLSKYVILIAIIILIFLFWKEGAGEQLKTKKPLSFSSLELPESLRTHDPREKQ
jgi:hypothetical protein